MKEYNLKIQESNNFCLCSVLQAILRRHEIYFSQREISNNLTPSEKGFFADDFKIKRFLRDKNLIYEFYWHNETPFNERDSFLDEMHKNEGIIGINHHVYLLNEFRDPFIKMTNPEDAKIIDTNLFLITKEMHEKDGFFGLIKYIF